MRTIGSAFQRLSARFNPVLRGGLLCGLLVLIAGQASVEERTALERVRMKFGEGAILHAEMTHEFRDSYTGETEVTEGEIWISKEKYKVKAEQQVVLVDGELSRVYNEQQNKLVISEYEPQEDDFAPSRFFSDVEEIYTVSETFREDGHTGFVLQSDDPFEIFEEVTILLDDDLIPLEVRAVDQMENRIRTTFTNAEYLDSAESLFLLEYPENAEIVDLRK